MGPNISLILKLESESLILKFELIRVLKKKKNRSNILFHRLFVMREEIWWIWIKKRDTLLRSRRVIFWCARTYRARMRGAKKSRQPRGTAALPVYIAPRSSLKICQLRTRQRNVLFRDATSTVGQETGDVSNHTIRRDVIYFCFHLFSSWNNQGHREIIMQITVMLAGIPPVWRIYRSVFLPKDKIYCILFFFFFFLLYMPVNVVDLWSFTRTRYSNTHKHVHYILNKYFCFSIFRLFQQLYSGRFIVFFFSHLHAWDVLYTLKTDFLIWYVERTRSRNRFAQLIA